MSFTWNEIHQNFMRNSTTLTFQREFTAISNGEDCLRDFSDPAGLLDALHRKDGDPEDKNRILVRLISTAQSEDFRSDCALTLVLLALWPGLDAIRGRLARRRIMPSDDLPSELLSRATTAVRSVDLGRVKRIAATILRNIERDIVRDRVADADRKRDRVDIEPDAIGAAPAAGRERLRHDLARLVGPDGVLVMLVAVDGFTQAEAGAMVGLGPDAARKRYQRAIGRLRRHCAP